VAASRDMLATSGSRKRNSDGNGSADCRTSSDLQCKRACPQKKNGLSNYFRPIPSNNSNSNNNESALAAYQEDNSPIDIQQVSINTNSTSCVLRVCTVRILRLSQRLKMIVTGSYAVIDVNFIIPAF